MMNNDEFENLRLEYEKGKIAVKELSYEDLTLAELKEIAAAKNVNVSGMKKAEIIEALTK